MQFNLSLVKQHPYISGTVVIVGAIIVYSIFKGRSNGNTVPSTDTTLNGLNTAASLQSAQINAGVETAQLQGQVASNQIAAELEAVKVQQQTALAIVGKQEDTKFMIARDVDQTSLADTTVRANAATQIATTQANAVLGIANANRDIQLTTQQNLKDIALNLGTQKQLGSKVVGVLAAFQGPAAIAANQPTQVAQVRADQAGGPAGIISALNPAKLLASFFG